MKSIDDLIKHLIIEIKDCEENWCALEGESEDFIKGWNTGVLNTYHDVLEKVKELKANMEADNQDNGLVSHPIRHGHVTPMTYKARCGGPELCPDCQKELAQFNKSKPDQEPIK